MHGRKLWLPTLLSALLMAAGTAGEPERDPQAPHAQEPARETVRALTDADLTELEAIRRAVGSSAGADARSFRTALRQLAGPTPTDKVPAATESATGSLVTALRQSARHFEAVAATAEERGDYSAADEARETAQRLWREARRVPE